MPVMKAKQAPRMRESAIVMDLSDLEREAARIVSEARMEAARIVADAKAAALREALQIREQARQAGHEEGSKAGFEQGQQKGHDEALQQAASGLQELTKRWNETLDLLQQHMPPHLADARTDLVRLALAIAQRITLQKSLSDKQVISATVEEVLRMVGTARRVSLHVHPNEEAILENYLPDLLAKLRGIDSVELLGDETLTPGGCVVSFGAGQIDATLETRLQRIADELLGADAQPQEPQSPGGSQ